MTEAEHTSDTTDQAAQGRLKKISLRALARDSGVVLSGHFGQAALAFLLSVVMSRGLGPAAYGVWGVALNLVAIVRLVVGFDCQDPLTRDLVRARSSGELARAPLLIATALGIEAVGGLATCLGVGLAAPLMLRRLAGGPEATQAFWLVTIGYLLTFSLNATWYAVIRDQRRFSLIVVFALVQVGLHLGLASALFFAGRLDLGNVASTYAFAGLVFFCLQAISLERALRASYGFGWRNLPFRQVFRRRHELRDFWEFVLVRYVEMGATGVAQRADVLLLGWYAPAAVVGHYRLARQATAILGGIGNQAGRVFYQDLNELVAAGRYDLVRRSTAKILRWWAPAFSLLGLLICACSGWLLQTVYGPDYAAAKTMFDVLMIQVIIGGAIFWPVPLARAMGSYRRVLRPVLVYNLLCLLLMAGAAAVWGAVAVAVVNVLLRAGTVGIYWWRNTLDLRAVGGRPPAAPPEAPEPLVG